MNTRLVLLVLLGGTCGLCADKGESPAGEKSVVLDEAVAPDAVEQGERVDYFQQGYLTGDWFGYRPKAAESGVTLNGSMTADFLGNPTGGFSQGFAAASSLGLQLVLDMEKIASIKGTEFVTSMIWRAGNNLSAERIGNLYTVAQLYGGQNLRLYEFMIRQHLFDDRILVQAGRMGAFDNFLSHPIYGNFVNNGICGNPKGIFYSVPAFGQTVYPTSSWGLFAKYTPEQDDWYVQAGGYLLDSDNGANHTSGLNWTFDTDEGAAGFLQGGITVNGKEEDEGLPGQYSVGAFFSGDNQPTYDTVPTSESNVGFYFMLEQMLQRREGEANLAKKRNAWGPGAQEGLSAFSAIVVTPDDNISMFPVFVTGGLVYQGLIPSRSDDFASIGVIWGGISDELQEQQRLAAQPVQTEETVLEFNYRYYATPFFYIQPDLQYVFRPGGTGDIADALVLGAQVSVTF